MVYTSMASACRGERLLQEAFYMVGDSKTTAVENMSEASHKEGSDLMTQWQGAEQVDNISLWLRNNKKTEALVQYGADLPFGKHKLLTIVLTIAILKL